jgi:hypothetical protein
MVAVYRSHGGGLVWRSYIGLVYRSVMVASWWHGVASWCGGLMVWCGGLMVAVSIERQSIQLLIQLVYQIETLNFMYYSTRSVVRGRVKSFNLGHFRALSEVFYIRGNGIVAHNGTLQYNTVTI